MTRNPFGDDPDLPSRTNPFGEELETLSPAEAANRCEQAARKIRTLRSQVTTEGLPLPALRELILEVSAALEAAARALRGLTKE
jgi:hypothetical protein